VNQRFRRALLSDDPLDALLEGAVAARPPLWFCIFALVAITCKDNALAQLAPTGDHYAGRSSDTGFEPGEVNASGGYTASVLLDLPAARGGLPIPLQITSGARGVGAAGLGWDIPLSYVRRDTTFQHRRPAIGNDTPPQGRERVFVSLQGRVLDLVPKGNDWIPRRDAPGLVLHEQNGTWVLFDGGGLTWTFTAPSALSGTGLWPLSSVISPDGNRVELDYDIGTPVLPGNVPVEGLSIDLAHISYNTHPALGCPKNEIALTYQPALTTPLSMSMLGDRTLARMRILDHIDVLSRANCGGGPTGRLHRLRRYLFSYPDGDADTGLPRLRSVRMSGREGTPEGDDENSAIPIAAYAYGSASKGGKLTYQKKQSIPLPSSADSKKISSTEQDAVNAPGGCCVGYATWQSLTDITGDGRPDLVYQNGRTGQLWVAANVPAAGGSTTFGSISLLHDASFTNGALETRMATNNRFNYNISGDANIDEVWRKAIDVNGDGRLDIIDAAEEPGHWVVYLNTPDSGPSGIKWVRRKISIAKLYEHLSGHGHIFLGNYVPLTRRFTAHEFTSIQCFRWDPTQQKWEDYPLGWGTDCVRSDPSKPLVTDEGELTITEWDLIDLNGDGYPDVVFNSAPFQLVSLSSRPSFVPTPPNEEHFTIATEEQVEVRPVSWINGKPNPIDNHIDAVINVLGVHFDDGNYLFSSPITILDEGACAVRRWRTALDQSHQHTSCDIADVNGDGLADRIEGGDVFLGTGHGFSDVKIALPGSMALPGSFAEQFSEQGSACATSSPPPFAAGQLRGLRDLNGDNIPDYIELVPGNLRPPQVRFGTGTGFGPPVDIVTEPDLGNLIYSLETESCDGQFSRTTSGLFDIDGDGKPDVVVLNGAFLDVYQLAGGELPGIPEAARLVRIDNGYGAATNVHYRSAKEDGSTPHQVPFPEIVVSSIQTVSTQSGGMLNATLYAYGNAEMIFDSALDAFTLPSYGRSVELRVIPGQGDWVDGLAVLTDTYGLDPFAIDPSAVTSKKDRFRAYLRASHVRDQTMLKNVGIDPWTLLAIDITADSRRIAATHYDRDPKLFDEAASSADPMDCMDIIYPYDFARSFLHPAAYNICSAHGFLYASVTDSWRGDEAPPSARNVVTRSQVLEVDENGRAINVLHENDHFRADDDICIETHFATPNGQNAPLLSAPRSRRIWDCNRESAHTLGAEYFEYDNLPSGQVSRGHVTAHTVERRATDDGSPQGTVRAFEASYDAAGNAATIKSQREDREDGAARTLTRMLTIDYDTFGLAKVRVNIDATGIPPLEVRVARDLSSLDPLTVTDANLTQRGVDRDGFGRVVRSTFTPPGGSLGVLSTISYLGFDTADTQGRRVVTTTFSDPVPLGNLNTATGRTATIYLDELGRGRRVEVELGTDYANQVLIAGLRKYDLLGRVAFEADPFPASQDPSTAYGTTFFFNTDGTPSCFIRGKGPQAYSWTTDEPTERYPTCFTRSFASHEETLGTLSAAALLPTSPEAGVTRLATRSAIGWILTRSTWRTGTRLEHTAFAYDRLGQPTTMTRYDDPVLLSGPVQASWRLDSLGQILESSEPESATKYSRYSDWGELLEVKWIDATTSTDRRVILHYDALGRRTYREERNNGTTDADTVSEYLYDVGVSPAPQITPTYVLGRLAQVNTPTGGSYFSYDAFGRVTARTFTDTDANVYVEKSTFRGDGARSTLEFYLPDTGFNRELFEYGYDTAARLRTIKFSDSSAAGMLYQVLDMDPFGRVRKARFGGGTHYEAKYADVGRRLMNEVTIASTQGSRRIIYLGYDPLSRQMSRHEIKDGAASGIMTNVAYDRLGRLSSAVKTDGTTTLSSWHYAYDALGNLVHLKDLLDPGREVAMCFGPGDRDRVCRIGYGSGGCWQTGTTCNIHYDGVGNIIDQHTRTGQRSLNYFGSGKVRSIVEGTAQATFRYDAFGEVQELNVTGAGVSDTRHDRRYGRLFELRDDVVNGTATTFISRNIPGPGGIFASRRGPGNNWVFGFAELRGGRTFTDNNGTFVQDVDYEPYGEAKSSGVQPGSSQYSNAQWNGAEALTPFGLSYLGARLYDPVVGRFLSRDPVMMPRTAATTNAYAFASNDPLNRSDPSGLQEGEGPGSEPGSGEEPYIPSGQSGQSGQPAPSTSNPQAASRPPAPMAPSLVENYSPPPIRPPPQEQPTDAVFMQKWLWSLLSGTALGVLATTPGAVATGPGALVSGGGIAVAARVGVIFGAFLLGVEGGDYLHEMHERRLAWTAKTWGRVWLSGLQHGHDLVKDVGPLLGDRDFTGMTLNARGQQQVREIYEKWAREVTAYLDYRGKTYEEAYWDDVKQKTIVLGGEKAVRYHLEWAESEIAWEIFDQYRDPQNWDRPTSPTIGDTGWWGALEYVGSHN
jgi:RHS repeat-associated protein